jgi:hypothetical protein
LYISVIYKNGNDKINKLDYAISYTLFNNGGMEVSLKEDIRFDIVNKLAAHIEKLEMDNEIHILEDELKLFKI